jgi:excisionase family DNA binding protein
MSRTKKVEFSMPIPRLLNEAEAASFAGVSRKTIRRLIEQGRLKACDYLARRKKRSSLRACLRCNTAAGDQPAHLSFD